MGTAGDDDLLYRVNTFRYHLQSGSRLRMFWGCDNINKSANLPKKRCSDDLCHPNILRKKEIQQLGTCSGTEDVYPDLRSSIYRPIHLLLQALTRY